MANLRITKRIVHLNVDDKKVSVGSEATEDEDVVGENDWKNVLEEEPKRVAKSPSPVVGPVMGQLGKKSLILKHLNMKLTLIYNNLDHN